MAIFPLNCRVLRIERPLAMDRYGEAKYGVVASGLPGLLQHRRQHVRGEGHDFVTVDATLMLQASADVRAGDRVTIDNADEDKYTAFTSDPVYDGAGGIMAYSVSLTKVKSR